MEFLTHITIPKTSFTCSYKEQVVLLGSCFAENIGRKLRGNKFLVDMNPFGVLYNPASIAQAIRMLLQPERFTGNDLLRHEGVYHSFAHHSQFSSSSETECLDGINDRLFSSAEYLRKAERMIITVGTAYVYRLKSTGEIVSNCHKLPEKMFSRSMLSMQDIVSEWKPLLLSLWEQNPDLKILFTVSPIRHWKDGAHGNQLSKATLLLAIEQVEKAFPERVFYFPAYELMMDELRDYRFYADDMLHPSPQAVEYIWQRFSENILTKEAQEILKEWGEIQKALNHKPFQPNGEAYKQFISQTLLKMERINEKIPSFDITKEIQTIKTKQLTMDN